MKEKLVFAEYQVNMKLIIMSAWVALMCLYIYCDFLSLFRPGQLGTMSSGKMGSFDVSQSSMLWAGILMAIPSLMIFITPFATSRVSRIINLVISPPYILVNIGNLVGETWIYYYFFGLLELGLVITIFVMALRWPRKGS